VNVAVQQPMAPSSGAPRSIDLFVTGAKQRSEERIAQWMRISGGDRLVRSPSTVRLVVHTWMGHAVRPMPRYVDSSMLFAAGK
jgi:hypothetical protein